jgi:hypothetical protein
MGKIQDINDTLERLPEAYRQEALDFIEFLTRKAQERQEPIPHHPEVSPQDNPLLKLIGIAHVEPFADRIDEQLYG